MYYVVVCGAAGVSLPKLPSLSLFDDGELSLWREFARSMQRERQLVWDEIDARRVAEDRLAELIGAVNALASERHSTSVLRPRVEALEAELVEIHSRYEAVISETQAELSRTQAAFAREASVHAETRARLAFRETLPGWLRWPLSVARRRLTARQA